MRLYGIGRDTATTIIAFILDYFQKKNFLNKFLINFSKNLKNLLARIWALFAQIWSKMNFCGKKDFKYYNYLPSCQKSETTLELMDGQADRQTAVIL